MGLGWPGSSALGWTGLGWAAQLSTALPQKLRLQFGQARGPVNIQKLYPVGARTLDAHIATAPLRKFFQLWQSRGPVDIQKLYPVGARTPDAHIATSPLLNLF